MDWQVLGKMLLFFGFIIVAAGAILLGLGKLFNLGNLPGDIVFKRGGFTLYFPIVSSILLSIILTIVLNLLFRR